LNCLNVKKGGLWSSKTTKRFYQSTQHKISEALNIHVHISKKLKSHKFVRDFI
jgi:hypothetical protein